MRETSGGKTWKQYVSLIDKNGRKDRFWTFYGSELFFDFYTGV